jgi:DNA-binding beta-propeller fold protein YncE
MTPRLLRAACLFVLAAPLPASARQGYSEVERGPNWVKAAYQFGACGKAPGQLLEPRAVALGREDRVYVADSGNHRIQVFTLEGKTVGGWGRAGSGDSEFLFPAGIAVGPGNELYVADSGNDRIQVFDESGKFLRKWGKSGTAAGEFSSPRWLTATREGIVVVEGDRPRIQVFTPGGELVRSFGGFGDAPGQFRSPSGVAADDQGNLYVADAGAHRIQKFDPQGTPILRWGQWGVHPGLFSSPAGLAYVDGKLYVADGANHRVQVFDRAGAFLFQWGRHPAFAHEGNGRLHFPSGIAVSASGGFTVLCEPVEHRVQAFSNGSARVAKTMTDLPWWDSLHARFHVKTRPTGSHGDKPSTLVAMVEPDTHSVLVYDLESKVPTFVARAGGFGMKLGEFADPAGLALDPSTRRITVSERGNRRLQVLELPADPRTPTGFAPGFRAIATWELAAALTPPPEGILPERCVPGALALGPEGSLYLVDEGNSAVIVFNRGMKPVRTIRSSARPSRFVDVALAPGGGIVYVVDRLARKVLAFDAEGKPLPSWEAPGDFLLPAGVAADGDGSVYVTDSGAHQVLKVDARGKFLLRWGSCGREAGQLHGPKGVVAIKPNRIVVEDAGNHRGHIFSSDGEVVELFHLGGFTPPPLPAK